MSKQKLSKEIQGNIPELDYLIAGGSKRIGYSVLQRWADRAAELEAKIALKKERR